MTDNTGRVMLTGLDVERRQTGQFVSQTVSES